MVNAFLAWLFWNKKSRYCHHLGIIGIGIVAGFVGGFGVTNYNLGHICVIIEDKYLKIGMCVHLHNRWDNSSSIFQKLCPFLNTRFFFLPIQHLQPSIGTHMQCSCKNYAPFFYLKSSVYYPAPGQPSFGICMQCSCRFLTGKLVFLKANCNLNQIIKLFVTCIQIDKYLASCTIIFNTGRPVVMERFKPWITSVRFDIFHFMWQFTKELTTQHHPLYGTFCSKLSSCIFIWDKNDYANLR